MACQLKIMNAIIILIRKEMKCCFFRRYTEYVTKLNSVKILDANDC